MQGYLNRVQSETIKGILIILIVFGHNHILCPNTIKGGMMEYLYLFHIAGFFILPFFYEPKGRLSWEKVGDIIVRCWVPYLWICLICWLVFSIYSKHFDFGWGHVAAIVNGTQSPVSHYFGFVFPWFLPTYCSFSLLLLIARKSRIFYLLFFIIGFGTFFMTWNQFYQFKNTIPFGLGLAVNFFASGVIVYYANKLFPACKFMGGFLFIILSCCWWLKIELGVFLQLFPTTFFLFLLCLLPYMQTSWLRFLGKHSLCIYLTHVYIINVFDRLFPHTMIWGIIILLFSLIFSLIIAVCIERNKYIRTVLFPKSWRDSFAYIGLINKI